MTSQLVSQIEFDTEASAKQQTADIKSEAAKTLSDPELSEKLIEEEAGPRSLDKPVKLNGNISEVWKIWQLKYNFLSLMGLLTLTSFVYYVINFQMKNIPGSLVQNTIVSQLAEISADIVSGVILTSIGHTYGFQSMFALTIGGTLLLMAFQTNLTLIPLFITMAKFGVSAAFNMVYIGSVQLIPTLFSSSVFGLCNVVARLITMASPVVAEMKQPTPLLLVMGGSACAIVIAKFLVVNLPRFE